MPQPGAPLQGVRISGCLHITTETANLAHTLKAAGADVVLCASNPLSNEWSGTSAMTDVESVVEPYGVLNNFWWETITFVKI